jgi:hypothetical protein
VIYQLPKDGSWIEYDYVVQIHDSVGKPTRLRKGTLKVSSVGSEVDDTEVCRWIEIKQIVKFQGTTEEAEKADQKLAQPEIIELYKVLAPEKWLVRGEQPIKHLIRSWYKEGGTRHPRTGVVRDWATQKPFKYGRGNALNQLDFEKYLNGPRPQVDVRGPEDIESVLGPLSCECVIGTFKGKLRPDQSRTFFRETTWVNPEAPFGVIKMQNDYGTITPNNIEIIKNRAVYTVVKKGDNAVSEIPDAK